MSAVVTVNPATGERLAEYPAFSDAEVDAMLAGARELSGQAARGLQVIAAYEGLEVNVGNVAKVGK